MTGGQLGIWPNAVTVLLFSAADCSCADAAALRSLLHKTGPRSEAFDRSSLHAPCVVRVGSVRRQGMDLRLTGLSEILA